MEEKDEISLAMLLSNLKEYAVLVWSKKWYILISGILLGSILLYFESRKNTEYKAELTFMLYEDGGGAMNGISAILGNFGIGGATKAGSNLLKIREIAFSNRILNEIILSSTQTENGETELIGNKLIEEFDLRKDWEESSLKEFKFKPADDSSSENYNQLSVLATLRNKIRGSAEVIGAASFIINDDTEIVSLAYTTSNADFSIALANLHFKKLCEFYDLRSSAIQDNTQRTIKHKEDSVLREMNSAENQLASLQDRSRGLVLNTNKVRMEQLNKKIYMLSQMYAEIVTQRGTSELLNLSETSKFQLLDEPTLPVDPIKPKLLFRSILGFMLGSVFSIIIFLIYFWFQEQKI